MSRLAGLRVAVVGPLPPPAGGMANQTRQLVELLQQAQARVTLVQSNAPYRPRWVGRVRVLRAAFRLLPYLLRLWQAAGRADVMHVMANSGWSWHLFAAPAVWIARWRGVPVVVNYRGGEAASFLQHSGALVRWTMRRATRLAVPSGFLEKVFARHRMPAVVLPNVVDLDRFGQRQALTAQGAHLVVARNLETLYDNATALRAFARVLQAMPQARLTIAGSGPEHAALTALADQLGVAAQVRFTGRLDRDGMARLLQEADVMLNPSLADNMPNSLLESMACGLPVVSTWVGGVPYLVSDSQTALLVPPGDDDAMAAAALRLLHEPALWQRLSRNGLAEAQRYSWHRVSPLLARLYRSAMEREAA